MSLNINSFYLCVSPVPKTFCLSFLSVRTISSHPCLQTHVCIFCWYEDTCRGSPIARAPSKILYCVQNERFREVICVGSSHCQFHCGNTTLHTVLRHLTLYKKRNSFHISNLMNPLVSLSFPSSMFYITLSYTIYFSPIVWWNKWAIVWLYRSHLLSFSVLCITSLTQSDARTFAHLSPCHL